MTRWFAAVVMAASLAFIAGGAVLAQSSPSEREPEEPTVFPDGENRDEVFYTCTACHGSDLVRAQGHSPINPNPDFRGRATRDVPPEVRGNLDSKTHFA